MLVFLSNNQKIRWQRQQRISVVVCQFWIGANCHVCDSNSSRSRDKNSSLRSASLLNVSLQTYTHKKNAAKDSCSLFLKMPPRTLLWQYVVANCMRLRRPCRDTILIQALASQADLCTSSGSLNICVFSQPKWLKFGLQTKFSKCLDTQNFSSLSFVLSEL